MPVRTTLAAVLMALALLGAPSLAQAGESPSVTTGHATATLLSGSDAVAPGQPLDLALRLQLAPGWHTYWRNPGDAGLAPELGLALPPGTTAGPIEWPAPQRTSEGTLTAYAYTGDLVLPFTVTPGSGPLTLQAHPTWLICKDICVPEEAALELHLPSGTPAPSAQAPLIAAARLTQPRQAPFTAAFAPDGTLDLTGPSLPPASAQLDFFPLSDGMVNSAAPQLPRRAGNHLSIRLHLSALPAPGAPLPGVLRVAEAGKVLDYTLTAQPASTLPRPASDPLAPAIFVAALAGGFLLNLMPCVFPVLAMKAMALSRLSGGDRRRIRAEAASYTGGVISAFLVLGGALIALRAAGESVGWGFQLQSPVFVTVIAWVLFATGLNMSGVFSVAANAAPLAAAGASRRGHLGSFLTGLLAVVVATPCTAAFMGTAIAGALTSPAPAALGIFATMGLGLALPYAALGTFPRLAALLPRPGAWMERLRQLLAFPLYASVVWLGWVVSQQEGPHAVLTIGLGLVGVGFAAWAWGAAQASPGRGRLGRAAAGASLLATVLLLTDAAAAPAETSEPFSAARLAELRGEGRPVFVNMTASWCLSCLVNERIALAPRPVQDAFARAHVAYLKGDWTRKDPVISAFLQDHGRDGVPLYLFYPPGQPAIMLPQILSEGVLLSQIDKVKS